MPDELPRPRRPRASVCLLVLAGVNLMWAFQFSGAKIATQRLGPVTVTLLPMLLATLLLIPWLVLVPGTRRSPLGTPGAVRDFTLLAIFGATPAQVCLTLGVQHSLASNASVLTLTIPVLTALLANLLLHERMTPLRWLSFAMAIAGVLLVSNIDWEGVALFHSSYLLGNALIFLSCVGSAFYNSFSKRVLERFSPVEVLVYSYLVADAILGGLMLWLEPPSWSELTGLGASVWLSLAVIAIFSLCVSMALYFWVIQHIDVTQASLSIYLLPVFGVIISSATLHEKITVQLMVGGALVFVSTYLVTIFEERRRMACPASLTPSFTDSTTKVYEE